MVVKRNKAGVLKEGSERHNGYLESVYESNLLVIPAPYQVRGKLQSGTI